MQTFPIPTVKDTAHGIQIINDAFCKNLGLFVMAVSGIPCSGWFHAHAGDPRNPLTHNEFKVFLFAFRLNIPAHDEFNIVFA